MKWDHLEKLSLSVNIDPSEIDGELVDLLIECVCSIKNLKFLDLNIANLLYCSD